ncbi:hypothetical protein [Lactiplantibacillus plantarum]|uniref:hypothetical protein n=1 Tax=Lactiplantibacillus plantarum TaxID=1590 RepID=UPI00070DB522|nr:hypothetical protein [Lactiplantibacillus plantarum]
MTEQYSIGVIRTNIDKLSFNIMNENEKQSPEKSKGELTIDRLKKEIDDNNIAVKAVMPFDKSGDGFSIRMEVIGIFAIPKSLEAVLLNEDVNNPELNELVSRLSKVLINKFKLVTAQLSLEVNNFPIIPEMSFDSEEIQRTK